jgi:3-oxoacyl-[acyl-carrier protein] reductase
VSGSTSGRTVAITGAGRGLGLLTVRTLLEQDSNVVANYRSQSPELDLLAKQYSSKLLLVQGDASDEGTAKALVHAAAEFGGLDALIHNAAITRDGAAVLLSVEDWDEVMRVNLRGAFVVSKHALRPMMRQRSGRIVYVSSTVAYIGNSGQAAYAASKAGLQGLALSIAQEYRAYNVRTVVVAFGLLDTGLGVELTDRHRERLGAMSLAGIGDPGQSAQTLAFLTSPAADFINATVVRADGGVKYG